MSNATKSLCFTEFLHYMDNGDPGAKSAILAMLDAHEPAKMTNALNKLDDNDIRGSDLWEMFTECKMDVQAFFRRVESL